jgi:protease-4
MLKRLRRWLLRTALLVGLFLGYAIIHDYLVHRVAPGSVLVVTLQGPVVERGRVGISELISSREATPLNQVRGAINRAVRDPRVEGVVLKVIEPEMELAQAQEIAALVHHAAAHGKWTAAYLETAGELSPGNLPYLDAISAGDVSLMPQGELNLMGVGIRELFARETLDWLGVRPNFGAIGKYKSAMNVFTEKDFTPAQREEDEALVSDLYEQLVRQIGGERHLKPETIRALIDQAPLTPETGMRAHLVDRLEYADQFDERIKHHGGVSHALLDYGDYTRPWILPSLHGRDRIAVVYGDGDIDRGGDLEGIPGQEEMTADKIMDAFKDAREDDTVKAIVFRINSPGGSVLASELIRREAERTAREKPVIVSMSGYAASGGYWVATPARRIIADPGTITGSIGVLAGKFNVAPMAEKFGIKGGAVTRGANFEMFDEFTDFTPAQAKIVQEQVLGDTYQRFVNLVAASRHMSFQQVDQVAQGRVWTGEQALEIRLVDALGGFDAALDAAKAEANLKPDTPVELVELPRQPSIIEQIMGGGANARASLGGIEAFGRPLRWWLAKLALAHRGALAYCRIVPVM